VPTDDAIREALRRVIDPELRRDVVELRMVREIEVSADGDVAVGIALTVAGCPLKAKIRDDVVTEVGKVPGVRDVHVRFTHMTPEERSELSTHLRGGATPRSKGVSVDERTRVLAIASGKGGVGKSSVTVNLALALRAMGREVGVIDADIYGFSIPGMLGIHQRPVTVDRMIVPPVAHDLKVMSIGFFLDEGGAVMWRGPMLHKALEQFMSDVHWGALDYLVVDMPPGTGDVAISLAQLLPRAEALIVTTPQAAAQRVAQRAAAVAAHTKMTVTGVIENMSYRVCPCCGERDDVFGTGGGSDLADQLGVPLLGEIPLEPALREGGDVGVPHYTVDPESPASYATTEVAARIEAMRPRDPVARISRRLTVL
jgi:ATP-binding protein involved in chromosome partitioning